MKFRKYLYIFSLAIFCWASLVDSALATATYLDLTPNTDIVNAGYFYDLPTGTANFGNATEQYNLNRQNRARIGQAGNVEHFQMYFASKPSQLTSFKIEVWRQNTSDSRLFSRIYSGDFLSQVQAGVSDLYPSNLASPETWAVQVGDFILYSWTASSAPGNFLTATDLGAGDASSTAYRATAPATTDQNWNNATSTKTSLLVPIKTFMRAPLAIAIGDSHVAGWFNGLGSLELSSSAAGFISPIVVNDYTFNTSFPKYLSSLLGVGVQNMGIGGQLTSEIEARFSNNVINNGIPKKAKIAIIEGGLNDINIGGVSKADYLDKMQSMIETAIENDIFPIVILMNPFDFEGDMVAKSILKDDWNNSLRELVANYDAAVVDNSNLGAYCSTAGSTPGNKWTVDPTYGSNGHYNAVGYAQMAQNIYDVVNAYVPPYVMGTDKIFVSATTRTFGTEKFRNKTHNTDSNKADLNITIPNDNVDDWIDISVSAWETATSNRRKTWTESSTATNLTSGSTNIVHIVGDLEANKYYNIQVDSNSTNLTGSGCVVSGSNLVCQADGSGKITFTYGGHYSTHTFDVTLDTTSPTLYFADNVAAGPIKSDTIIAGWGDSSVKKWKYNDNTTCSETSADYPKTNSDSMNQADATNNGKYICLYGEDGNGNKATLASDNDINIDVTAPTISNLSPSGSIFSVSTANVTINLTTNETATCKFSTTSGTGYAEMAAFDATNNTSHSSVVNNLAAGNTYHYYIKCQDNLTNETGESEITFSVAPIENKASLNSIKIKIKNETNKFKDKIYSFKNKFKLKNSDTNLANGMVKIYKNNKLWKTISADAQGAWSSLLKLKNTFSGWIKVKQHDQYGTQIGSNKVKLKIDTEKPKFTKFISALKSISKGQKLTWEATDNEGIDKYKIYFNGKIDNNDDPYFEIPKDIKNGIYSIRVKASDKAGNSETKQTWVRVIN